LDETRAACFDSIVAALGRAGGYELLVELAAGGMATVYLARAVDLLKTDGRDLPLVALKRPHRHLASDKTFMSMLLDEARLASQIEHPNVVKVRELAFEAGEPFIVLDYVEGTSLSDLRKELGAHDFAIESKVALRIVLDALAGLHAAHELKDENGRHLGIIHRDVSPHNVLVGVDGKARLTDFGIAKAEDRIQTTRTHEVKGKLAYLAPERVDKRRTCTVQSDVFAMAVCAWECVAGRRLFRGDEAVDILQEVMNAPIPRLRQLGAHVSNALDEAIARGLSRDLETRFKSAAEFSQALTAAAGRNGVASAREVSRLVEAVFGPRLRIRHQKVRAVLEPEAAEKLFLASSLPVRPPPPADSASVADPMLLAAVAAPAPTARYSFGPIQTPLPKTRSRSATVSIAIGVGAGLVLGGIGVFAYSHRAKPAVAAPEPSPAATATPAPTTRRIVVTLPFLATQVELDGVGKTLSPAADVAVFEVPADSPQRHKLSAIALDGTRADGYAREESGIAQPEPGLAFDIPAPLPTASQAGAPAGAGVRRTKPAGTTRNGFTKLR
jgi:serine/threonine-protein kinase